MRTKEEIAVSLGYKLNDSFGSKTWYKDGINYLKLSDTPDNKLIDALHYHQNQGAKYTIVFFCLAVFDFSLIKLTEPEFGVSMVLFVLGAAAMAYALQGAKAWRQW
jgi:hypothetical protein